MKRSIIGLVLIIAMLVVAFAGCSSTGTDTASASSTAATQSTAAASASSSTVADNTAATQSATASATHEAYEDYSWTPSAMPAGGWKIGFANCYIGNAWRAQFINGITQTFDNYKKQGLVSDYSIASCNSDVTEQLNQLNTMLNDNYNAIIIDPVSADSLSSVIKEAKEKGILIIIGNDPAAYKNVYAICPSMYSYSDIEMHWLAQKMGGKGNLIEMFGLAGSSSCEIHRLAVNSVLSENPNIKVLGEGNGQWTDTQSQPAMATMISSYGDKINGVWCEDGMSMGIVNAFLNAGYDVSSIPPLGGDYFKTFIDYWGKNQDKLKSIIVPNSPTANGKLCVDFTMDILQGKKVNPDVLTENPLDKNVKNYIASDMPAVVLSKEDMSGDTSYLDKYPYIQKMTIDDAVKMMSGAESSAAMNVSYSEAYLKSLFVQ